MHHQSRYSEKFWTSSMRGCWNFQCLLSAISLKTLSSISCIFFFIIVHNEIKNAIPCKIIPISGRIFFAYSAFLGNICAYFTFFRILFWRIFWRFLEVYEIFGIFEFLFDIFSMDPPPPSNFGSFAFGETHSLFQNCGSERYKMLRAA